MGGVSAVERTALRREKERIVTMIAEKMKPLVNNNSAIRAMFEEGKRLAAQYGAENVYDFSGINEFTEDYHNYYEAGHYRPLLGNKLLERIYKRQ